MVVVLLGPPGAGKGKKATMLSSALHLPHISTDNLLRKKKKKKTSLGRE
ncbi:MAG: nucleoside monophosphate kinase, partial [Chlamydiia bacterium]|nr:nucleoside monophosphate kinase [Chlamydiia bacterium]